MKINELEQYRDRMVKEFKYPETALNLVTGKLENMDQNLKNNFIKWWNTGEYQDVDIEGYSIDRLKRESKMNVIAAFLTLDWLIREPEKAKNSLKRGHDRIQ